MRRERTRQRAACNRLHHRGLDLEVPSRRHEFAHRADDAAPRLEDPTRLGIDDEIEIPLPVPDFDIGQSVPLLGQRQEALRQEMQARRPDRQLVRLRSEQASLHAHPVAEVEQLEDFEIELRQRILTDVHLNARQTVRHDQEVRLAERSNREDAAAGDGGDVIRLELVVRSDTVRADELGNRLPPLEPARVDVDPELRQLLEV